MSDATGAFSRAGSGFVLRVGPEDRAVVARLLDELRTLLVQPDQASAPALARLFPVVHPDDAELEGEYQRLMRDELVASRVAGINAVEAALRGSDPVAPAVMFDEEQLLAFMQAINGVRLVLGTLLGVTDYSGDENDDELVDDDGVRDDTGALTPERHLYAYLSWLLDSAVAALSPGTVF